LVEHVIRNDGVTGSSPVCGTNQISYLGYFSGSSKNPRAGKPVAVGAAAFALTTGEQLKSMPGPSPKLVPNIAAATCTGTIATVSFSPLTFAKVEPPPPVIPAGDKQQQG
jgi:hypothetical protein